MALFNSGYRHNRPVVKGNDGTGSKPGLFYRLNELKPFNTNPIVMTVLSFAIMIMPVLFAAASSLTANTKNPCLKATEKCADIYKKCGVIRYF